MSETFKVVGSRQPLVDSWEKVAGTAVYGDDVRFPNTLVCRLLRSTLAHAKIVRIDTSRAEAMPGVRGVVTGQDGAARFGVLPISQLVVSAPERLVSEVMTTDFVSFQPEDKADEASQAVERYEAIGRSGQTGLAGGDHLHFTMLLNGYAITPIDWWSEQWVEDRIIRKLREAE